MHRNYLKDTDYQANSFTLKALGIFCILFAVIWILNALNIFIVDSSLMNVGFFGSIIIGALAAVGCKIYGMSNPVTKYIVIFFTTACCIFSEVLLTYHATLISIFPILLSVQYRQKKAVLFAYLMAAIGLIISVYGGYYFGLCNANMLLFTAHKTEFYLQQVLSGNLMPNDPGLPINIALFIFFVVPQWFIMLALSPILFHISKQIETRAKNEMLFNRQAETDFMTGLKNEDHYRNMVKDYYPTKKSVAVITWDINNIKEINERQGHAAGDTLIAMMAETIKPLQSVSKIGFRVGGDEFILIMEDPLEGIINKMLLKWNSKIDEINKTSSLKLAASMGYAQGEGKDIEKIITEAYKVMYNFRDTAKMAAIPR